MNSESTYIRKPIEKKNECLCCGYVGCKRSASYKITLLVGKKQTLYACSQCAPAWVKSGDIPYYYTVEELQ